MFSLEGNTLYYLEDNVKCGYLNFEIENNTLDILSTVVDEKYRGKGIASKLTEYIYNYTVENGLNIKCTCSYAKEWFNKRNKK